MTREEMIEALIERELEINFTDPSYVRDVLRSGFKGYDHMTDEEIKTLYEQMT